LITTSEFELVGKLQVTLIHYNCMAEPHTITAHIGQTHRQVNRQPTRGHQGACNRMAPPPMSDHKIRIEHIKKASMIVYRTLRQWTSHSRDTRKQNKTNVSRTALRTIGVDGRWRGMAMGENMLPWTTLASGHRPLG
jgi:hypothetical protein